MTARQVMSLSKDDRMKATHAVVNFLDEQSICTVPLKMIKLGLDVYPQLATIYPVKWTNRKAYDAEVLALGTKEEMREEEANFVRRREEMIMEGEIKEDGPKKTMVSEMVNTKKGKSSGVKRKLECDKQEKPNKQPKTSSNELRIIGLGSPATSKDIQNANNSSTESSFDISPIKEINGETVINLSHSSSMSDICIDDLQEKRIKKLEEEVDLMKTENKNLLHNYNSLLTKVAMLEKFVNERKTTEPMDLVPSNLQHTSPSLFSPDTAYCKTPPPLPPPIDRQILSFPVDHKESLSSHNPQVTTPQTTYHLTPIQDKSPKKLAINNSPSFFMTVRAMSCSRGNFAANLNRKWFTVEERKGSNVRGVSGKKQLSPKRIEMIHQAVFNMYPLNQKENERQCWGECIKAIDVCNRRLNRGGKENQL